MDFSKIEIKPKNYDESFLFKGKELNHKISDFWSWSQSDLIGNTTRGILAEFIVKSALEIKSEVRNEWYEYDLITENGIKIEVKSSAYLQTWAQKKFSKIIFNMAPTKTLNKNNIYSGESIRRADIYIFCLLKHKIQKTLNPMDLNQWIFFLIKTDILDKVFGNQKMLSLSVLEKQCSVSCNYFELKSKFLNYTNQV